MPSDDVKARAEKVRGQENEKDMSKAERIKFRAAMDVKVICTGDFQYEWVGCTMEDFEENPVRKAKFERAEKNLAVKAMFLRSATIKEQLQRDGVNEVFD